MKLNATQTHIKIPLASLRITTNVRTDFDETEIAELAQSIKENGLINAITVRPPVTDENGDKTYEVIAGGRRIRAHQWLCDHGDDFSMIDCKISTGDMWTIQMIENIQRTDLTPREKENAIARALDQGMSQKEIAEKLSKPQTYISDIVAGMKVRKIADAAYLNTDAVSTKALAQLRGIPESEIDNYIGLLIQKGGTVTAATELLHEWRAKQEQAAPTTSESNEESEIDVDTVIDGMFMGEADDIEYDDDIPDGDDENTIAPTETTEADFNESNQDFEPKLKIRTEPKSTKKPDGFNWYINTPERMADALLRLPFEFRRMPADTKICVQAGSKVAEISSVIYEPEENRLIFRCLEDFSIH